MLEFARLCLTPLAIVALSCPGGVVEPQVSEQQAVDVARRQVLFEPEAVDAEMAADAQPPVWRVTLRGRLPGQSVFDFEEATVTVDAFTGDVIGVDQR
ncbi:MAG: PepSY domain-containing protein [Acidobacteria bacterium]|nr:PepSY domain-containing protein [Acidobacteriota bacterium]